MAAQPLVSVIIPCYNALDFVADAIDSILLSDYPQYEILVIDDGSIDPVAPYLTSRYRHIPNLICIRQENKGLAGARNTGILQAKGNFLVFLDADDIVLPQKLSIQLNFFQNNPALAIVYSLSEWFIGNELLNTRPVNFPVYEGNILPNLLFGNFIHVNSVMVKKEAVLQAGLFDSNLRELEDWDLWLRMSMNGATVGCVKEILSRVRLHYGSMTSNQDKMNKTMVRVLEKNEPEFLNHYGKNTTLLKMYYVAMGNFIIQAATKEKFWPLIRRALGALSLGFVFPGTKLMLKYFRSYFFKTRNKTTEELENVWNTDKQPG